MPALNVHTAQQREFIVKRLAAFETPKDIAVAFCARFRDTACNEDDVRATDPTIAVVSPELLAMFKAEREQILLDPDSAPLADQKARLIVLSRQALRYENNNQPGEARVVLRQIAEETGAIAGKGGKIPELPGDNTPIVAITRTIIDPVAPESV